MHIGATIYKMLLEGDKTCWKISYEQYVKAEVTNAEESLTRYGRRLLSKCVTPLSSKYFPWLEESP